MADATPEYRDDVTAERPTRRAGGIPTDPAELEAWKREFTDDIVHGEPGGIPLTWTERSA